MKGSQQIQIIVFQRHQSYAIYQFSRGECLVGMKSLSHCRNGDNAGYIVSHWSNHCFSYFGLISRPLSQGAVIAGGMPPKG